MVKAANYTKTTGGSVRKDGNHPSPKAFGYCARNEKVGKKM
jgi:hypothetical protein